MPWDCSRLAPEISLTRLETSWKLATRVSIVVPASFTWEAPASMVRTELPMRALISWAAWAERWARLRTSVATTAKPRPCSPARAASTAALRARMLVWKAIESITPMMSLILLERSWISFIVATTCRTTVLPRITSSWERVASALAWRALSAFWRTVALSCSIELAVSSRLLACSSVRADRSALPLAISWAPSSTSLDEALIWRTICTIESSSELTPSERDSSMPDLPAREIWRVRSPATAALTTDRVSSTVWRRASSSST